MEVSEEEIKDKEILEDPAVSNTFEAGAKLRCLEEVGKIVVV